MAVRQIVFLSALNFHYFFRIPVFFSLEKEPKNGHQPLLQVPRGSSHQQVNVVTYCAFQVIPR
jgi:hypothetical protein